MPNRCASVLCCAAWLASGAALAQPVSEPPAAQAAPSTAVAPVTVQAAPDKVIKGQASRFVQSYAAAANNPAVDQIARWRDPVCVQVGRLPLADQAAKIKARIESMAQALGLPAARAGCKPNVEIVFADQPQNTMDLVAKLDEPLLGYYHLSRTKRLKTVTHPIQAWYVTTTRAKGVDTVALQTSGLPASYFQPYAGLIDDPENQTPVGCVSRFTTCQASTFVNVFILADNKALVGQTLGLVADDMVMLALSQPKSLDGCNALPSVIDRFAKSACPGRDPPNGLTPADTAYLSALYSADPEGRKGAAEFDIANRMAKVLIKANAAAAAGVAGPTASPPADAKAR